MYTLVLGGPAAGKSTLVDYILRNYDDEFLKRVKIVDLEWKEYAAWFEYQGEVTDVPDTFGDGRWWRELTQYERKHLWEDRPPGRSIPSQYKFLFKIPVITALFRHSKQITGFGNGGNWQELHDTFPWDRVVLLHRTPDDFLAKSAKKALDPKNAHTWPAADRGKTLRQYAELLALARIGNWQVIDTGRLPTFRQAAALLEPNIREFSGLRVMRTSPQHNCPDGKRRDTYWASGALWCPECGYLGDKDSLRAQGYTVH
jgi:hypothetical protein